MGAGPSPDAVRRAMRKASKQASLFTDRTGQRCLPRLQRASNGEACIVYDVFDINYPHVGDITTVLSLEDYNDKNERLADTQSVACGVQ